ncbi:hypothetical protein [Pseudomonas sp. NBRC 111140]|uniref:hypothetical protein n=1 Tax=Pseudomonas sp. NBRC 111140 TaxID=1661055 RepID=UPI000761763A|nr:hypothetical protein [Pseudomonas sp. NBRC 111140]
MKLQQQIRATIGWCISLGIKFIRVVPIITFLVQVSTLASQIFLLLAFFLPLKVIILLGSEKTPSYFPSILQTLEKDHLIYALTAAAALCYIAYLMSELATALLCRKGTRTLLARTSKLNLFENQDKIATNAYSRFNRAMAGAAFFSLSALALLYVYPSLLLAILAYLVIAGSVCVLTYNHVKKVRESFHNHHGPILNALAATGFLLSFFFLVTDFLYYQHSKIFNAVIAVLIMRQGLQRLSSMILDIVGLRIQHRQVNALFYQSQPLIELRPQSNGLEYILDAENREKWVKALLEKLNLEAAGGYQMHWHQVGFADIYAFTLQLDQQDDVGALLVKVFGSNISSSALQERTLLVTQPCLPGLPFVGHYKVNDIDCHVYKFEGAEKLSGGRKIGEGILAIAQKLILLEPSAALIAQFTRTRLYLEQRLDEATINSLRLACINVDDTGNVERIIGNLPAITHHLAALPRQIVPLDITNNTILASPTSGFVLSHWSNWRIEAIGCSWPVAQKDALLETLRSADQRQALASADPQKVWLAALMYMLERHIVRKDYSAALALTPDIVKCIEILDTPVAAEGATQ